MLDFSFLSWADTNTTAGSFVSLIPLVVIAGVSVGIVILPSVLRLHKSIGPKRLAQCALAALFIVIGTIPPVVVGLLWYARRVDYLWAIHGPVPFSYVGGGEAAWLWTFIWTVGFSVVCWGVAAWLEVRSRRGDGTNRPSRILRDGASTDLLS